MDFNYILRSIFALILIIWLANVLLKKLSMYMHGQSKTIQVIERFSTSKNSSLAIVKIINKYYLMSFNENSNEILKEFAVDEVDEIAKVIREQEIVKSSSFIIDIDFKELKNKYATFLKKD